jgi:hypothetical protein
LSTTLLLIRLLLDGGEEKTWILLESGAETGCVLLEGSGETAWVLLELIWPYFVFILKPVLLVPDCGTWIFYLISLAELTFIWG